MYPYTFIYCFVIQNFLFTAKDENSALKVIDFGLSDLVKPGYTYISTSYLKSLNPVAVCIMCFDLFLLCR